MSNLGNLDYNPNHEKVKGLLTWYQQSIKDLIDQVPSKLNDDLIHPLKIEQLSISNVKKGNCIYVLTGKISYVKMNKYQACSICKKKLENITKTNFICPKCSQHCTNFEDRAVFTVLVVCPSQQFWITIFQDIVEQLLRFKLEKSFFEDINESTKYLESFKQRKIEMTIKTSVQQYNGNETLKHVCTAIKEIA